MSVVKSERFFRSMGIKAAKAAEDKKGEEILLLHIHPITTLADYMLLVNINSPAHLRAVEESIRLTLKQEGVLATHRDGRHSELWRVIDYGGLLVHLLHPRAREFYALDKLFHEARKVAINGSRRAPA